MGSAQTSSSCASDSTAKHCCSGAKRAGRKLEGSQPRQQSMHLATTLYFPCVKADALLDRLAVQQGAETHGTR